LSSFTNIHIVYGRFLTCNKQNRVFEHELNKRITNKKTNPSSSDSDMDGIGYALLTNEQQTNNKQNAILQLHLKKKRKKRLKEVYFGFSLSAASWDMSSTP